MNAKESIEIEQGYWAGIMKGHTLQQVRKRSRRTAVYHALVDTDLTNMY